MVLKTRLANPSFAKNPQLLSPLQGALLLNLHLPGAQSCITAFIYENFSNELDLVASSCAPECNWSAKFARSGAQNLWSAVDLNLSGYSLLDEMNELFTKPMQVSYIISYLDANQFKNSSRSKPHHHCIYVIMFDKPSIEKWLILIPPLFVMFFE